MKPLTKGNNSRILLLILLLQILITTISADTQQYDAALDMNKDGCIRDSDKFLFDKMIDEVLKGARDSSYYPETEIDNDGTVTLKDSTKYASDFNLYANKPCTEPPKKFDAAVKTSDITRDGCVKDNDLYLFDYLYQESAAGYRSGAFHEELDFEEEGIENNRINQLDKDKFNAEFFSKVNNCTKGVNPIPTATVFVPANPEVAFDLTHDGCIKDDDVFLFGKMYNDVIKGSKEVSYYLDIDFNNDKLVNSIDYGSFNSNANNYLNKCISSPPKASEIKADLTNDGCVKDNDYYLFEYYYNAALLNNVFNQKVDFSVDSAINHFDKDKFVTEYNLYLGKCEDNKDTPPTVIIPGKNTQTVAEGTPPIEEPLIAEGTSGDVCNPDLLKKFNFNLNNKIDSEDIMLFRIITEEGEDYSEYDATGDKQFTNDDIAFLESCKETAVPLLDLACNCPDVIEDGKTNSADLIELSVNVGKKYQKNIETTFSLIDTYDLKCVENYLKIGNCDTQTKNFCVDGTQVNSCTASRPQFCNGNAQLSNNCFACGCPENKRCGADGKCSDNKCEVIIYSGEPEDKLDIVFLGDGYNAADINKFGGDVNNFLVGLLSYEPFKSQKSKINIYRIFTTDDFGCRNNCENEDRTRKTICPTGVQPTAENQCCKPRSIRCSKVSEINSAASGCPNDEVIIIYNSELYGGRGESLTAPAISYRGDYRVMVHEFGHTFAGLSDEYSIGREAAADNTEDEGSNCQKNSPCNKWADLNGVENVGCFQGCYYNNWYRPLQSNSLMYDLNGDFGPVNERYLTNILKGYT